MESDLPANRLLAEAKRLAAEANSSDTAHRAAELAVGSAALRRSIQLGDARQEPPFQPQGDKQ